MLLDDIADYLTSQGVHGTIRKGYSLDQPDQEIALYETGGLPTVHTLDSSPGTGPVERPAIQVMVRDETREYARAYRQAHGIWKLLDSMPERTINGRRYLYIESDQSPFPMMRDNDTRILFGCNYRILAEPSTSTST